MSEVADVPSLPQPPTPPAAPARADRRAIAREIERLVSREPLDRVKCVNVFGDHYRCNWWAPPPPAAPGAAAFDWSTAATHHVRASRLLHVTSTADGRLTIRHVRGRIAGRDVTGQTPDAPGQEGDHA